MIDGAYNSNRYTLTGMNSTEMADTIVAVTTNKEVVIRNMNINYTNTYGVVYVPLDSNYIGLLTTYENINFNGTRLAYNPYGRVKIVDSYIVIEETNGVASQEICMGNYVIIGGKSTMTSSSVNSSLFYFRNNLTPSIIFLFIIYSMISFCPVVSLLLSGSFAANGRLLKSKPCAKRKLYECMT